MCRWHKLAAKEAATNPQTGEFNVGQYAVALTAMGLLRVEQDKWGMADLFEIDGFNPKELLEDGIWQGFAQSPYNKDLRTAQRDLALNITILRHALETTAQAFDLSPATLNIQDRITKDGYKKTCCAQPNPRENGPFLDAAVVYLAKGYDDTLRSYASGELALITADELEQLQDDPSVSEHDRRYIPVLEGLRSATEYFLALPDTRKALEGAFANSLTVIFQTAADDLAAGRGLEGPSDCIMCEGAKGRKTNNPRLG